jgi:hypothetical protein
MNEFQTRKTKDGIPKKPKNVHCGISLKKEGAVRKQLKMARSKKWEQVRRELKKLK